MCVCVCWGGSWTDEANLFLFYDLKHRRGGNALNHLVPEPFQRSLLITCTRNFFVFHGTEQVLLSLCFNLLRFLSFSLCCQLLRGPATVTVWWGFSLSTLFQIPAHSLWWSCKCVAVSGAYKTLKLGGVVVIKTALWFFTAATVIKNARYDTS